jgi:hypothetical protein
MSQTFIFFSFRRNGGGWYFFPIIVQFSVQKINTQKEKRCLQTARVRAIIKKNEKRGMRYGRKKDQKADGSAV